MEINTLIFFVIAALSINLIPGPDVIYIVTNSMTGNIKSGIAASLGLGLGGGCFRAFCFDFKLCIFVYSY
jgi:threonine/homoserine/homoserine lactone efflux protein